MRDLERRLREGNRSEKLDQKIIVDKADREVVHPQADKVTPQGYLRPRRAPSVEELSWFLKDKTGVDEFLRDILRSSSIVVVVGWRGPSVVVVGDKSCCAHLDAL